MYESPIELVYHETFPKLIQQQEELIMRGCLDVGVYVDKEELIKALAYDRGQYEKGFRDGRPPKGEWITDPFGDAPCLCSICGYKESMKAYHFFKYCPNCGARMVEE